MLVELLALAGAGAIGWYIATHEISSKPRSNPQRQRRIFHVIDLRDRWKVRDVSGRGSWRTVKTSTNIALEAVKQALRKQDVGLPEEGVVTVEEFGTPGEGFVNVYLFDATTAKHSLIDSAQTGKSAELARQTADAMVDELAPSLGQWQSMVVVHEDEINKYMLSSDPMYHEGLTWRHPWEKEPLPEKRPMPGG